MMPPVIIVHRLLIDPAAVNLRNVAGKNEPRIEPALRAALKNCGSSRTATKALFFRNANLPKTNAPPSCAHVPPNICGRFNEPGILFRRYIGQIRGNSNIRGKNT
jgi:hypothetical protein